ncbi:MAG TPA: tetratricopeptide repeat protein [Tepidisphaeraceae bacterium]|jgi:tetratricopeptide (TPR) repeat protein|nr:tetratricopeptide repeat protein [Tepidisphaeraceae bacterium]
MATSRASRSAQRFSQLWQLPLFILSIALFVYAGYLFISPGPGATIDQKIAVAQDYLKQDRPNAALQQLSRILETEKPLPAKEAQIHLLIAKSLEAAQTQDKIGVPANYERIIEQTELAVQLGIKPDADLHRRVADSYAALGHPAEAAENYRQAIAMDATHSLSLRRKLIELELANDDPANADVSLQDYLNQPKLTDAERAWALDQRAGILIDRKQFADARKLLADALRLDNDPVDQGTFNYQQGYCSYREGLPDDAERYLRLARDQLRVSHPLDADAAFYLGRIYQDRNDPTTAISFYDAVLVSHPESKAAPLALLCRGVCRIMMQDADAGLSDFHDLVEQIDRRPSRSKYKAECIASFRQAAEMLSDRQDYQSALEVMADEQSLAPSPSPGFYSEYGSTSEKRADQLEETIPDANPTEKIRRGQQVIDLRNKAGDAYILYSHQLTLLDDHGYSDALWKGVDLYDKAGNLQAAIAALELFVAERPSDRMAPDALLRLGRAYQAAGMFDKAIDAFQRCQLNYAKSLAASRCAVPLAEAYIAKGPTMYVRAEKTLLSVVENNPLVDPSAEEFRQSLRELAQLYYRTGRYEESIARLQELTQRYPNDAQKPQMIFMMADSYRKSAALLDAKLASAQTSPNAVASEVAEAAAARRDRLLKARGLYDQVIDLYRVSAPTQDVDKLYQKLAHFYRADCMYDLGAYQEAIKLYDDAAFSYQNDPASVSAYVQIVNAYFALGKPEEAKAANNRAKWMLQHMPAAAFQDGTFSMPKKYWDQWLQWTNDSGMW